MKNLIALVFLLSASLVAQACPHPAGVSDLTPLIQGCNDMPTGGPAPFLTLTDPLYASQPSTFWWRHVGSPVPVDQSQFLLCVVLVGATLPNMAISVPGSTFGSGCLLVQPLDSLDVFIYDWFQPCSDVPAFGLFAPVPAGIFPAGFTMYAQAVYQDYTDPAQGVAASQPIVITVQP